MSKLNYRFLILGLMIFGCNKPEPIPVEQDVLFKAAPIEIGFKSADNTCNNDIAHYALITIQPLEEDGITDKGDYFNKTIDIFYLNGTMYTNTLKLPLGKFKITSFVLMNDGPDNLSETEDDLAVYASPSDGSTYGDSVNNSLPLTFNVNAFMKNEVNIEVICFETADYDKFGFTWFALDVVTVSTEGYCFFGNICLDEAALDYYNANDNLYKSQTYGIRHDMPAIFRMKVSIWSPVYPYLDMEPNNNSQMWVNLQDITNLNPQSGETFPLFGEGAPLCVQNFENSENIIRYSLWVYMKETTGEYWNSTYDDISPDTPGFRYKFLTSWYSTDIDKPLDIDNDGVIDFAVGDCYPDADLVIQ